jgi:hypothetical protein
MGAPDGRSGVAGSGRAGTAGLDHGAAVRRRVALRISAAATIDRATAVQISHCRTSSRTVFITVWKMPRTVDRASRTKDALVVMRNVLSEKVSRVETADAGREQDDLHRVAVLAQEGVPARFGLGCGELVRAEPPGPGGRLS